MAGGARPRSFWDMGRTIYEDCSWRVDVSTTWQAREEARLESSLAHGLGAGDQLGSAIA